MLLASDLNRMMQEGVTLAVRNEQPGITVFVDDYTKTVTTWDGHGDPYGGDIKEVPPTILANPIFREHLMRGIYSMVEAPEDLQKAVDGMRAKWSQQVDKRANAAQEIEAAKDKVVASAQTCIAPKGKELCGTYVLVMGSDIPSDRPPLCTEHASLTSDYVSYQTGREVDGKPEIMWKRAQLARA